MMIHHQTKFDWKRIINCEDTAESGILDLNIHDTPAPHDAASFQMWLQKVQQFRRHRPDKQQLKQ